jgi:PAS domain S-box-containing protein
MPIQILWGPEYILLYNDAYRPILGDKHPHSLGQRGEDVWYEVWEFAGPRLERVRETHEAIGEDDQFLLLERNGYLEECYFTFSYTPIEDETGQVAGIFNEVHETTHRVLKERRQQLQTCLANRTAEAKTDEEVCQIATSVLADGAVDIPLALFYLLKPNQTSATLISAVGLQPENRVSCIPQGVELVDQRAASSHELGEWLFQALQTQHPVCVDLSATQWSSLPTQSWNVSPQTALVLPLGIAHCNPILGFMIVAINPRRSLDADYRSFLEAIAQHLALMIANVRAYEAERQRAEMLIALNHAQQEAQTRLAEQAQLLDLALDAILMRDLNGKIIFWNDGAHLTYGWTQAEVLGQCSHTLLQTQFPKPLADIEADLFATDHWEGELIQICRDGIPITVMGRWALKRDDQGQPIAVLEVNHNITDRKRIEDALQASEERFRLAARAIAGVVYDWNTYTNHVYRSEGLYDLIGIHPYEADPTRDWWSERIHPEDLGRLQTQMVDLRTAHRDRYDVEYRVRHRDGRWIDVWDRGYLIRNPQGLPIRVVGFTADITTRKRAEAELRNSELNFRTLADTMPQIFWTARPDGWVDYYNRRWYEFTGRSSVESQGWNWESILHPDDRQACILAWQTAVQTGQDYQIEYRYRRASDGQYRWFLGRAFPLRDEQGQIIRWFGSSTDIHDQKIALEERDRALQYERLAREEAEASNRIKDEFLAVLSHELRSPLNPILGWSNLLLNRDLDPQTTRRALEAIARNAQLQTQLIEDLLDVSRILQGKLILNKNPVDLVPIIEAALETVQLAAEAKDIQIQTIFRVSSCYVFGDSARLQQILWNLLSNAVKFTPTGGQVEVKLECLAFSVLDFNLENFNSQSDSNSQSSSLSSPLQPYLSPNSSQPSIFNSSISPSYIQIQVKDTGKGINPEFLPYVFDRFRQEDSKTTRQFGGLGLGLAIVRYLTELHGGIVWAESPGEAQGTTFTIQLPHLVDAPQPSITNETNPTYQAQLPSNLRILVVDDETDMQEVIVTILNQYPVEVRVASSAVAALAILDEFQPHVLISDIGMPDVDGYTLMRQIRQRSPHPNQATVNRNLPKAIALTAYAGELNEKKALAAGFQKHLAKPVEPSALIAAIAGLVNGS